MRWRVAASLTFVDGPISTGGPALPVSGRAGVGPGTGWSRGALTFLTTLAVLAATLAAFGGSLEIRLGGARLRVGGFKRPFLLSLLLLVAVGLRRDGWLRSLLAGRRSPAATPPAAELCRRLVVAACVLTVGLMLSPALLPAGPEWPGGPPARLGFLLCGLVGALTVARSRWGLLPRRLEGSEVLLLVGLPLYTLLVGNGVLVTSGDNHATRVLAPVLLTRGSLDLSDLPVFPYYAGEPLHYSGLRVGGRVLPSFPLGTGLLALPYSALALAGSGGEITEELVARWEKHLSALVLSAAAMVLFLGLRRRFPQGPALAVTGIFALGTTAFTCAGQALWTTTGEVFFLSAAVALLVGDSPGTWRLSLAGLCTGGAFLCRPTALVPAGILAVVVGSGRRRDAVPFLATSAAAIGVSCLALYRLYGHPLGGYGLMNSGAGMWGSRGLVGLAGNLASPSRGLLTHLPYLLFVPLAARKTLGDRSLRAWWFGSLAAAGATLALASAYSMWWGGYGQGPRMLTEAAPFLALLTIPLWLAWGELGRTRAVFLSAVAFAVATQLLGAYNPRAAQWNGLVRPEVEPGVLWSLRDSQLAATWVPGWTLSAVPPAEETTGDPSRWHRLDLSAAANARYELDPFRPGSAEGSFPHYSRIDPEAFNRPRSLFHFGKRGAVNSITTCHGARPGEVEGPGVRVSELHAVLAAGVTDGRSDEPVVASLVLAYADGSEESLPIRLNRDAFEYHPHLRGSPVPESRLYWGLPPDADALVRARFRPSRPGVAVRAVRLVGVDTPSGIGVSVLGMTAVEPGGEPAER